MPATDAGADRARQATQLSRRRKLVYTGALVVATAAVTLLLAEAASQVILGLHYGWRLLPRREPAMDYDSLLGWKPKKNYYSPKLPLTHNAQGFRATRDYPRDVPPGKYRIICLGDSFTYGAVGDYDTYPAQFEALSPLIEAVNMGGGAYGIDQSYLRYKRDGALIEANLVLFAFIADDFQRATSDTFLMRYPKPRIVVHGNALVVENVPVPTWGTSARGWIDDFPKATALFRILRKAQEGLTSDDDIFHLAERIFDEMKASTGQRNEKFVLVYLPTREDLAKGQPSVVARRVDGITKAIEVPFLNLTGTFAALPRSERALNFLPDGHYSARGNLLVAKTLLDQLQQRFPEVPR
jgi:hypothetical protein